MTESSANEHDYGLQDDAIKAMRSAVEKVMREHCRLGIPVHVWENGQVVEISPDELNQGNLV